MSKSEHSAVKYFKARFNYHIRVVAKLYVLHLTREI